MTGKLPGLNLRHERTRSPGQIFVQHGEPPEFIRHPHPDHPGIPDIREKSNSLRGQFHGGETSTNRSHRLLQGFNLFRGHIAQKQKREVKLRGRRPAHGTGRALPAQVILNLRHFGPDLRRNTDRHEEALNGRDVGSGHARQFSFLKNQPPAPIIGSDSMNTNLPAILGLAAILALTGCSTAKTGTGKNSVTLFNGHNLDGWNQIPPNSWTVTNGVLASLGAGRGEIYTTGQYSHYRLLFTMRHIPAAKHDHQACVLIFCQEPQPGVKPLDALGGIQFQPPNGGSWDYRPGHNNSGKREYTHPPHAKFDPREWSRVELLVNAADGTARMAVAQPPGSKAVEVLDFKEPTAGRTGPIAWQMHNAGLFDEYKDVTLEVDPKVDELITTK